jgi:hypothetical protein
MKITRVVHKNFQLVFNSEVFDGEILDTEVTILPAYNFGPEDNRFFVIAGTDIKQFTEEFAALVNKYKI